MCQPETLCGQNCRENMAAYGFSFDIGIVEKWSAQLSLLQLAQGASRLGSRNAEEAERALKLRKTDCTHKSQQVPLSDTCQSKRLQPEVKK